MYFFKPFHDFHDTSLFRSVDTYVRNYDIRMGKLYQDCVGCIDPFLLTYTDYKLIVFVSVVQILLHQHHSLMTDSASLYHHWIALYDCWIKILESFSMSTYMIHITSTVVDTAP